MKKLLLSVLLIFSFVLTQAQCPSFLGTGFETVSSIPYSDNGHNTSADVDDINSGNTADQCDANYLSGNDYVYIFTPTVSQDYNISLTNQSSIWGGFHVYDSCPDTGSCVADATTSSSTDIATVTMNAGTTYYIIVDIYASPSSYTYDFSIETPPAPPSNDECSGAVALTVNADLACGAVTSGTIESATASPEDPSACSGTEDDDVWFSFVATETEHAIELTNVSGSTTDLYHSVWEGTCGGLSLLSGSCSDPNTSTASGLTVGNTYYLRVYTWTATGGQNTTFDVCIGTNPPPPANDDCSGATPYTNAFTMYTEGNCVSNNSLDLSGATDDASTDTPSCDTSGNFGVWYTWTATSTGLDFTSGLGSPGIAVYQAGTCGSLVQVGCLNNTSGQINGLTVSNNYIIHIWDDTAGNTVEFCLEEFTPQPPPANDECGGATSLMISTDSSCNNAVSGTTNGALPSASGCTGGRDVWYSFTPASDGDYIASVTETFESSSSISTYIAVFEGSCGSLTQIGSSTSCFNTGNITFSAIGGTTYYYSIRSSSTTGYTEFDVCTYPVPPPPVNDACSGAITINNGDSLNGDNSFATNIENLTPCSGGAAGTSCPTGVNDGTIDFGVGVWYVYSSLGNESITVEANGFDTELQIFSGSCGSLGCVAGDDDSSSQGCCGSRVCFDSLSAGDYYIYVDGHSSNTGAFTISLNTTPLPPSNDECANAELIQDPTVTVNGTNVGATDSGINDSCVTMGDDVWYSFTTDADGGDVTVSLSAGFDYAIYADCAANLAATGCNTGLTGAPADTTYYLRIGDDGSGSTRAEGTFSFSLGGSALSVDSFNVLDSFKYYPNPVENTLTLNAQQNIELVNVYNMLGQEVMRLAPNSTDTEVDMSPLLSGAYFVKVSVSGATKTVRIIKQ